MAGVPPRDLGVAPLGGRELVALHQQVGKPDVARAPAHPAGLLGDEAGKTHLAQAYGRECCVRGPRTYHVKASEPGDRLSGAAERGNASRVAATLARPFCLVIDGVGRRALDKTCTDLFFDVVDRRYEKESPNAMVLTSNVAPSGWDEFLAGDDTLPCALDRLFDKASVFMMRGPSYR